MHDLVQHAQGLIQESLTTQVAEPKERIHHHKYIVRVRAQEKKGHAWQRLEPAYKAETLPADTVMITRLLVWPLCTNIWRTENHYNCSPK